ncbi:ComF family protein [Lactobacillus psittaci]
MCDSKFLPEMDFRKIFSLFNDLNQKLCHSCQGKFSYVVGGCSNCQSPRVENGLCRDCRAWQKAEKILLKNTAVCYYNQAFHDLSVAYKRYGDYQMKEVLKYLASPALKNFDADYYIPIPTTQSHIKKRGYDTISEVFDGLVPLSPFLSKVDGQKSQGEKNRQERLQTPQTFYIKTSATIKTGSKILLLDDIYTTGRTLYHARNAIFTAYPNVKIESFTISR